MKLPISSKRPLTVVIQGARCSGKSTLAMLIGDCLESHNIRTELVCFSPGSGMPQILKDRDPTKILILEEFV